MITAAIIQARMGSTRLPGKVMMDIADKPMLQHVIERTQQIKGLDMVIVAAPALAASCPIVKLTADCGAIPFLGSATDRILRFMQAASSYRVDLIMRITADCPLLRPDLCERVLDLYHKSDCHYAAIGWPKTYPKGYGCEIFSRHALSTAFISAKSEYDREHVTPWLERMLKCVYLTQDKDESHLNYSVDTADDLERIREIMNGKD